MAMRRDAQFLNPVSRHNAITNLVQICPKSNKEAFGLKTRQGGRFIPSTEIHFFKSWLYSKV